MIKENITAYVLTYEYEGEIFAPSQVLTSTPQEEEINLSYTPNFTMKLNDTYGYITNDGDIEVSFDLNSYNYTAYMNIINKSQKGEVTLQYVDGLSMTYAPEPEPEPVEPHFTSPADDTLITGTIDPETGEFIYPIEVVGSDGNNIAYDILVNHVTSDDYEHVVIVFTPGYDEETETETVAGVYLAIWEAGSGTATLTFNDGTQSFNTTFAYEVTGPVEPEPEPEYEILDYIYPTEARTYIETGVQNSADISFEMQYNMINIAEYGRLVGSSVTNFYEPETIIVDYEGNDLKYKWFGGQGMQSTGSANDYNVHKINYSPLEFYVDDTLVGSRENTGQAPEKTTSLRFFNGWSGSDGSSAPGDHSRLGDQGYFNLYYAKIYDNGTLVRDYVPVKRLSDNIYGLYDNVNGVFYRSANEGQWASEGYGSTEFSGQSKAVPEYIYPNT